MNYNKIEYTFKFKIRGVRLGTLKSFQYFLSRNQDKPTYFSLDSEFVEEKKLRDKSKI